MCFVNVTTDLSKGYGITIGMELKILQHRKRSSLFLNKKYGYSVYNIMTAI